MNCNKIIDKQPWKLNSEVSKACVMYKLLCLNYNTTLVSNSYILVQCSSRVVQEILGLCSYILHYKYLVWTTKRLLSGCKKMYTHYEN